MKTVLDRFVDLLEENGGDRGVARAAVREILLAVLKECFDDVPLMTETMALVCAAKGKGEDPFRIFQIVCLNFAAGLLGVGDEFDPKSVEGIPAESIRAALSRLEAEERMKNAAPR